jgi:hypothetical protein
LGCFIYDVKGNMVQDVAFYRVQQILMQPTF